MRPIKSFGERIADALVEDGLLSGKQVEELLELQKKEGTRLLKLILEKSYVGEVDMVVSMGRVLNVPPVNLGRIGIPQDIAALVPREMATNHKVLPVSRLENRLFLAMADPLNVLALDDVKRFTRLDVVPMIASERSILDKLNNLDSGRNTMEDIIQDAQRKAEAEADADADADSLEISREVSEDMNLDQLAASTEEAPVIKLANLIIVQAIKDRASDIHIEPFEKTVRLRYRIDGSLVDVTPPPKNMQVALASRLKIMSSLDNLGLDADTYRRFKSAVDAPHGLILVTGPTGSGKTTTLYSALNELNSPEYNIITVEDPVEFQIPGINQVPTKKEIGLTFANALRSILRQDPDIIMIGEIRDTETAEIAVESALTGHQVLSTMHCNDAPGAIARLDDMGIASFLISSSVILACAQRLMRRICSHCKEPVTYPNKRVQNRNIDPSIRAGGALYRGRGCERCKNSGYAGVMAIIEAMTVTDEIRRLIISRANSREMGKMAIGQGMRTLRMVALDRVRDGTSTLEQVLVLTSAH